MFINRKKLWTWKIKTNAHKHISVSGKENRYMRHKYIARYPSRKLPYNKLRAEPANQLSTHTSKKIKIKRL